MTGKGAIRWRTTRYHAAASMRPGRDDREGGELVTPLDLLRYASMRPGRDDREGEPRLEASRRSMSAASMRPGRDDREGVS